MRRGGYPLERNDLAIDEWKAMGVIEEEREFALLGVKS
jgi:hypothetical protein